MFVPSHWRIEQVYKTAVMMGCNAVRGMSLGINYESAAHLYPALGGGLNEDVAVGLDYAIHRAAAYGLHLIIPLGNDPNGYYGDKASFGNWGGTNFYTDEAAKTNFKAYINLLVNRVNTFNGLAYKDDPTIMCWETGNEMFPAGTWTADIAAYIKSVAPNQLVMDGKFGIDTASLTDDNVDIVSDHFYPMSTTRLDSDLATPNLSNKVFCVGEYDYNSTIGGGVTLATWLTALEDNKESIGIDLWWDLNVPADTYGYPMSYNQGTNAAYGDPTRQTKVDQLRAHTYINRSISAPSYPVAEAPVLSAGIGKLMTWQGVAYAKSYQMERSLTGSDTGFSVIASNLSEYSSPWIDPSPPAASAWYRVSGVNGDGAVGSPSNVLQITYEGPSVVLQPDGTAGKDTIISSAFASYNYGVYNNLIAGDASGEANTYRTLIQFDLTGIPAGSTITSATLSLFSGSENSDNSRTFRVYRLKRAWVEGTRDNVLDSPATGATWIRYDTVSNWQTAGGFGADDCEQTSIGSRNFRRYEAIGANEPKNFPLQVAAIEEMIPGGVWVNRGFLFKTDTELDDRFNFVSSDHATPELRPKLVMTYVEP